MAEGAEGLPPLCGAHRGLQCLLLFYSKVLSNPGLKKKNDADSCLVVILMILMGFASGQPRSQCCACRG